MEKQTVRGCGYLHTFDRLVDGAGMRVARDFSEQLSKNFVTLSRRFFESTGDIPFAYRERQISASILGAMSQFTEAVFAEAPTRRGSGNEETHGWIDYWAIYRNTTFLIELKHCYSSVRDGNANINRVSNSWNAANKQLGNLINESCEALRFRTGELFKVPLVVTTHFAWSGRDDLTNLAMNHDDICARHEAIVDGLSPNPVWSSLFIVKDDMRGPYELTTGWELYPAVSMFLSFDAVPVR